MSHLAFTAVHHDDRIETEFSDFLIRGKFYLTALEFHYELLERSVPCSILEDFFSNPENFYQFELNQSEVLSTSEVSLSNLAASHLSLFTADSVDRLGSEDQNSLDEQRKGEETISYLKVFEFELRKKNEEIRSLRERLTAATLGAAKTAELAEPSTPRYSQNEGFKNLESASNIEARALRFLINEYLLNNGYTLSAIQFSEESQSDDPQDLDDWEDVGLNCERPPNLLILLRASWRLFHQELSCRGSFKPCSKPIPSSAGASVEATNGSAMVANETIQTDLVVEALNEELETSKTALNALRCNFEATKAELEVARQQIGDLRGKVARIEAENVSLAQESTYWRNQLLCLKRDYPDLVGTTVKKRGRKFTSNEPLFNSSTGDTDAGKEAGEDGHSGTSPPRKESFSSEAVADFPKLTINKPQFTRRCSPEFVRCASEMLPPAEEGKVPLEVCRLADTLDEIIVTIGSQIQDILKHLPEDKKVLALPLLTQAICLHPRAAVRDQLLRTLFNLFADSSEAESREVEAKRSVIILRQCRDLATCLGPQRIESELLPQIWSQLNERPSSDLRKLLVSACGVIVPATPSRLRSSLLLSILLESIEEEKTEAVRALALRSLACVVVLMEDQDKVPQMITTLEATLRADWARAPPAIAALPCHPCQPCSAGGGSFNTCSNALSVSCNWLLPVVAQWCLELDSFNDLLLDPWLQRLKTLCYTLDVSKSRLNGGINSETPMRLKATFSTDEFFCIMTVLNRLVPFMFAFVIENLEFVQPDDVESCDELVLDDIDGAAEDAENAESEGEGEGQKVEDQREKSSPHDVDHCGCLFSPQCIVGRRRYEKLRGRFEQILTGSEVKRRLSQQRKHSVSGEVDGDQESDDEKAVLQLSTTSLSHQNDVWPAMDIIRHHHLLCIAQMMRAISPRPIDAPVGGLPEGAVAAEAHEDLEQDPISPEDFLLLMQTQFEDTYWVPWRLQPTSLVLTLCKELCYYVSLVGKVFGAAAVQSYLVEPFHTLLMKRSVQGYLEFDLKALPSGVFAAYCCLLTSTKSASEYSKVKMLIANAIFLHSRDSCSLHGVRAAIMALCRSEDAVVIAQEVLLPALRSCASCADPSVRRTASNIFYTLIAYLSDAGDLDSAATTKSNELQAAAVKHGNRHFSKIQAAPSLLEDCWQLANQLGRDDFASIGTVAFPHPTSSASSEIPPIDEHSADWSCISVALGPLFCLYSRMLRSSPYVTDMDLKEGRSPSGNSKIAGQVLALLERLMSMVGAGEQSPLDPSAVQFLVQRQHWETLVTGLLQVANRLFLTCPEDFRDTKVLPWLYHLTEINNIIPDLEQRTRLGQRLIAVFSTAAFCLGTETAMMAWVIPGLDRLRLDFVEAGEKTSAEELEQLSSDLRQRLANFSSPQPVQAAATDATKKRLRQKFTNLLNSATDSSISYGKKFPFVKHS